MMYMHEGVPNLSIEPTFSITSIYPTNLIGAMKDELVLDKVTFDTI